VHEALARIVGKGNDPGDVLFFSSAGNTAQRHWSGPFRGSSQGYHQWQPGQTDNRLTPWGDEQVSVELCCPSGAGYELSIHDAARGQPVSGAACRERSACSAVARFEPQPQHGYLVRVRHTGGGAGTFHVVVLGGGLEIATARGSIPFPADGPEVIAVGAVD